MNTCVGPTDSELFDVAYFCALASHDLVHASTSFSVSIFWSPLNDRLGHAHDHDGHDDDVALHLTAVTLVHFGCCHEIASDHASRGI